jgi:hypothetical protein
MGEHVYPNVSFQYLAGGDVETIQKALVKSLELNSIPYWQKDSGANPSNLFPMRTIQSVSRERQCVGRIELDRIDPSQVLVCFCLPGYPDEKDIAYHEPQIREALPPSAMYIRLLDADGQQSKLLANLGQYLHQFRIEQLKEIRAILVNAVGLIPVFGLTIQRQSTPALTPQPAAQEKPKEIENRDIPKEIQPLREDQKEVLRLWQSGHTAKEISLRTSRTEKTILNQLTLLRKMHGEKAVPRRK